MANEFDNFADEQNANAAKLYAKDAEGDWVPVELTDLGGGAGGGEGDGLTDAELRATPVPVSGPLTDTQLRAAPVPTALIGNSFPSTANSTTTLLGIGGVFTGAWEDVSEYGEIRVNATSAQSSATNGFVIQQSADGVTVDTTDTYTVTGAESKQISIPPGYKYVRIVYTNGGVAQSGRFQLQTLYHKVAGNPSSQRPSDARTNETDMVEGLSYGMIFNGTTWDRQRGDTTNGQDVDVTRLIPGVTATALGKAEDAVAASGDTGVAMLFVRTDVPASTSSATGDYDWGHTGPEGGQHTSEIATMATGMLTATVASLASTNATSVKASKGVVHGYDLFNTTTTPKYLKFFNKASAPTVGTDVPFLTILIPPQAGAAAHMRKQEFSTGIAYSITGAVGTADATAVAANDVVGDILYK